MNAPLSPWYTNEAAPDFLRRQENHPSSQQLEGANKDVLRIIQQHKLTPPLIRPQLSTVWQPRAVSLVAGGFSVQLRRGNLHRIST